MLLPRLLLRRRRFHLHGGAPGGLHVTAVAWLAVSQQGMPAASVRVVVDFGCLDVLEAVCSSQYAHVVNVLLVDKLLA
eukprot:50254-Chlamydomonas_euryale.AAC.3